MPYPNYHSARIRNPDDFARIVVLKTLDNGIMIYGGPLKSDPRGPSKNQAYRFPKDKFTVAEAKKWLNDHAIKYILFEPASEVKGEMIYDFDLGELCSEEIKIRVLTDIKQLTEGDENPFFATVKVLRVGKSRNKKNYSMENLQQVMSQLPLYGYKGHIREEDISTVYREPVTVWIGGEIVGEWLYFKGYIPPQYESLRKDVALSLRAGRPMPVSHLGWYKLVPQGEYYDIEDIRSISIDWGNAGLEGVEGAQVVEVGKEQIEQQINKEEDMLTREEILAALTLDDIKKERPDLVTSLSSEMQVSEEEKKKQKDQTEKITQLEKENVELKKQVLDTHREKLLSELKDEKIKGIAGDLLQGETIEDLDKNWKLVKEKLSKLEKPGMPIVSGADEKKPGSEFIEDRLLPAKKEE